MIIHTAFSSSLVVMHQAVQILRDEDSFAVIAGYIRFSD